MHLGLGPNPIPLQDGMVSWNASAADALDIWNGYLDFISISSVSGATVPQTSGDGVSSVFFSSTVFGDSFGEDTLAVTVLKNARPNILGEADVIFNTANRLNSYRGPQQLGVYDFHRIALHEFGHVIGLDHNSAPPLGAKLMEPIISDLDHLGADDVAGARDLYGATFYNSPLSRPFRVGYRFDDSLHPLNTPQSFTAIDLPPGISINPLTGRLPGTPTTSGVYDSVVTGHGAITDVSEAYPFTILGYEQVPGLLSILLNGASSLVADPIRPRVYFAGYAGIQMINTDTFEVTTLRAVTLGNVNVSLSSDGSTLLYTEGVSQPTQELRIDLETLKVLPALSIPGNRSAILEGLNNQAYVAGGSGVYQFDATTGALQASFIVSNWVPEIAIPPDRRALYVTYTSGDDSYLATYDISTANPQLLHQIAGPFAFPFPSADGQYLYCVKQATGGESLVRFPLPALSPAISGSALLF